MRRASSYRNRSTSLRSTPMALPSGSRHEHLVVTPDRSLRELVRDVGDPEPVGIGPLAVHASAQDHPLVAARLRPPIIPLPHLHVVSEEEPGRAIGPLVPSDPVRVEFGGSALEQ